MCGLVWAIIRQVKAIRVSDIVLREASFMAPGRAPGSDEEVRAERRRGRGGVGSRYGDGCDIGKAVAGKEAAGLAWLETCVH